MGSTPLQRRLRELLWPEDRFAVLYFLLIWALHFANGLPFTVWSLVSYYAAFLGSIATLAFVPFALRWLWRRWRRPAAAGTLAATAQEMILAARTLLPLLVVLIAYTNLKSRIHVFHGTLFDAQLARLDSILHAGGGDLLAWWLRMTNDGQMMTLLALAYFYAWLGFAVPASSALLAGGPRAFRRLLFALAILYAAGGFLYVAIPSLGPAFFERSRFAHLGWCWAYQVQESMLRALLAVAANPHSPAVPFFGIAAFPSLHLGTTSLGLFACWEQRRWLFWIFLPFNLVVAWSAAVWGWHYVVDFYAGVALAWGAWRLAGRLIGRSSGAASAVAHQ